MRTLTFWRHLVNSRPTTICFALFLLGAACLGEEGSPKGTAPSPPSRHLQLWLRADKGVERSGTFVSMWHGQSGHHRDARAERASMPKWLADAVNGKPAVRFDGLHTHLVVPHDAALNPENGLSVFCVFQYSGGFRLAQKKSNSTGLIRDAWFIGPQHGLGVAGRYATCPEFVPGRVLLQSSVYDPKAALIRIYNNGQLAAALRGVPKPAPNADPLFIGKRCRPGATEGHLDGELAELLVYNVALSDAARQDVEAYLRQKYAVTAQPRRMVYITRVVPGDERVELHWITTSRAPADASVRFRVECKLRYAPWSQATSVAVPLGNNSGAVAGLFNHADYALRVVVEDARTGKTLGSSADRLVTPGVMPGVVIDYLHKDDARFEPYGRYVGSPSIARLPDGTLVASHDLFGGQISEFTRVFRSRDGGHTWQWVSDIKQGTFWGKLFVHRGKLFLLASSRQLAGLVLHYSLDGGAAWTPIVLAPGRFHKAPMPVVKHRGRLWTCVESTGKRGWATGFGAVAVSVSVDADLTKPKNWRFSAPLRYNPSWAPREWTERRGVWGFLEGNAVVGPGGELFNILRYSSPPYYRKAIVLRIAPDGQSLSFDRIIDFYGSHTKFAIRRDPKTGVYWSLVNRIPDRNRPQAARNVLTLVKSRDLWHWTPVRDVLRDDRHWAHRYTGFQYVDWLFDGKDIVFVSRTAFNGAHTMHDANFLTFHRIRDYARPGPVGP